MLLLLSARGPLFIVRSAPAVERSTPRAPQATHLRSAATPSDPQHGTRHRGNLEMMRCVPLGLPAAGPAAYKAEIGRLLNAMADPDGVHRRLKSWGGGNFAAHQLRLCGYRNLVLEAKPEYTLTAGQLEEFVDIVEQCWLLGDWALIGREVIVPYILHLVRKHAA